MAEKSRYSALLSDRPMPKRRFRRRFFVASVPTFLDVSPRYSKTGKTVHTGYMDSFPRITVVVPIRNEERFIAKTLDYLLGQDYPASHLEILVIDGQSDDRTVEIVSAYASSDNRVKLLPNPQRLSSAGRALGVKHATGDVITFIDGHTYIDNDQLLKSSVELMLAKEVQVLSRPQFLETPENDDFQQAVALARESFLGHGLDSTIYTREDRSVDPTSSGATYRREVFEVVGNFDPRFDACEDVEFNHRVAKKGYRSYTSMRLAVYYYPRQNLAGLFRQMVRYGIGRCRLARRHPDTLGLSTLMPFLFVFGLPLIAFAGLFWKQAAGLAVLLASFYLLTVCTTSLILGLRSGWRIASKLPLIFAAIHIGLGYGFGVELAKSVAGRAVRIEPDGSGC